jgi:GR25 family glycosyltransferase involved in LPS biosynthesis
MTFAVGVVGHTSRQTQALHLGQQVGAHTVSIDDGTLGASRNHEAVLHYLAGEHRDFVVVLEDDAQPVDGFTDQLTAALDAAPAPIVSLYLGTGYPKYWQPGIRKATAKADALGAAWITSEHLLHAVGYCIRTDIAKDLVHALPGLVMPIDDAITTWARANNHRVAYTWPSLVQHEDGPSVIATRAPRNTARKAHRVGTRGTWTDTTELTY